MLRQHMFLMILLSVTKTFQNMLVLKISNNGFMVNQHLKALQNLNLNFNFVLRYNKKFNQKVIFFTKKDRYANYISYGTLWTCVDIMVAKIAVNGYFQRMLGTHKNLGTHD